MGNNKKRVAIIVTSVLMVKFFLVPHLKSLAKIYDVTLIVKNDEPEILRSLDLPLKIIILPIERKVNFLKDIYVLILLVNKIRNQKFDLVHTFTPKAGLLGSLAAWINCIPIRIHTFQGEIWANKKGLWRLILRLSDKLVAKLSTNIIVVSESERQYLIAEKIIQENKSSVIANGSISGVNFSQFNVDKVKRASLRKLIQLTDEDILFLYVGRLNEDKGLLDLGAAFHLLSKEIQNVHLLITGPDEENIISKLSAIKEVVGNRLTFQSYTSQPQHVMQSADVLVLPSYREGFGVVVIEAAACGIPAIGSNIYGIQDAIVLGETGLFFEKQSIPDLLEKMRWMVDNSGERVLMGLKARKRVEMSFNQTDIVNATLEFYADQFSRL